MEKWYQGNKDRVKFFLVYIREAHPTDGRQVPQNEREGVKYPQPKKEEDRRKVASDCVKNLKLSIPALIDDMEDSTEKAYSGWPDRIFIVGSDGKIAYRGDRGPAGFKVDDAEAALKKLLEQ